MTIANRLFREEEIWILEEWLTTASEISLPNPSISTTCLVMPSSPPSSKKNRGWLLFFPALAVLIIAIFVFTRPDPTEPVPEEPGKKYDLAALGLPPDWSELDRFQKTMSRETFLERLSTVYTKSGTWKQFIEIGETSARIGDYQLEFAQTDTDPPGSIWDWKIRDDLRPDRALPLEGLHIVLDPGHIGGDFAKIESRQYRHQGVTVREGTMTLAVAKKLRPLLEKAGASVTLIRTKLEPVTEKRAKDFTSPMLFYRTSEIRARAKLINQSIKPDLVLCLHFNGSSSRKPENNQHFHIILNGTYAAGELAHEDERFQMLQRLLSRTLDEEIPLSRHLAASFNRILDLPPYRYQSSSKTSQNVERHPNLWARNLLANRLYQCPVVFMEPYVMNSIPFLERFQSDPDAIYEEYAQAMAEGVVSYYSSEN